MTTRSSKSPLMQGKHILVVEDEAPIRDMVRFALERKGLTVTEAADVQDARLSIAGRRPDLILLDWMLPGVSGIEFAREIRADANLRDQADRMRRQLDEELAEPTVRAPVRKTLESLREHWEGLTRFIDDPRIPMDNNASERFVRGPATGRKNYYGSGAQWSGRLAATLFSIFATLRLWRINPRAWLTWYLQACAAADGQTPEDISRFLPWNLSDEHRDQCEGARDHRDHDRRRVDHGIPTSLTAG